MNDTRSLKSGPADFWTSLVILTLSTAMLLTALTFPLKGTYAGVRNAWYVSPALFPLIVSGGLIALGAMLLARAVKSGAAAEALSCIPGLPQAKLSENARLFWLIAAILTAYVYGLVPRIDFIAATALFLLAFTVAFHTQTRQAGRIVLSVYLALASLAFLASLAGYGPAARSRESYVADGAVWVVFLICVIALWATTRHDASARRRLRQCIVLSTLTPVFLGVVFKYGLLVPLPHEGLTVALTDMIRSAIRLAV